MIFAGLWPIDMNLAVRLACKQKYSNERTERRVPRVVRQISHRAHYDCGRAQRWNRQDRWYELDDITLDHALQTSISCVGYSVAMQVVNSRSPVPPLHNESTTFFLSYGRTVACGPVGMIPQLGF